MVLEGRGDRLAIDTLDRQFRLYGARGTAAAAKARHPSLRIAGIVDEADAQAFRHHIVDGVPEFRRVVAAQAAPIGDLARENAAQLLGGGRVAFEIGHGGPLQIGRRDLARNLAGGLFDGVAQGREVSPGSSTAPVRCNCSATNQHRAAQAAPTAHPAITSLGQCTPR